MKTTNETALRENIRNRQLRLDPIWIRDHYVCQWCNLIPEVIKHFEAAGKDSSWTVTGKANLDGHWYPATIRMEPSGAIRVVRTGEMLW